MEKVSYVQNRFIPGDVVELKSGSCLMTVIDTYNIKDNWLIPGVKCTYFNDLKKEIITLDLYEISLKKRVIYSD